MAKIFHLKITPKYTFSTVICFESWMMNTLYPGYKKLIVEVTYKID